MAETEARENRAPTMEEIVAEQKRRLDQARKAMSEAAKDPDNHEVLGKGKGHGGGACLKF